MQEESVYDQLKKLIGDDAMDCLSKAFGGLNIQMPKSQKDSHPIVLAVGVEAAKKMASTFGGEEIYIRKPGKRLLQERNKEIIRKYDKDGNALEVWRVHDVHPHERQDAEVRALARGYWTWTGY